MRVDASCTRHEACSVLPIRRGWWGQTCQTRGRTLRLRSAKMSANSRQIEEYPCNPNASTSACSWLIGKEFASIIIAGLLQCLLANEDFNARISGGASSRKVASHIDNRTWLRYIHLEITTRKPQPVRRQSVRISKNLSHALIMSQTQCAVHDAVTGSIDKENSKEPDKKVKSRRPASTSALSSS